MKSALRWSWFPGDETTAPPQLLAAIARSFSGHDCAYRCAISQHKGLVGPTVHVVSLGRQSIVAWTGPGAPESIMHLPKALEAAQRAIEAGLFVTRSVGASRTSRKTKASVGLGTVGTIRAGVARLPAPPRLSAHQGI